MKILRVSNERKVMDKINSCRYYEVAGLVGSRKILLRVSEAFRFGLDSFAMDRPPNHAKEENYAHKHRS